MDAAILIMEMYPSASGSVSVSVSTKQRVFDPDTDTDPDPEDPITFIFRIAGMDESTLASGCTIRA